VSGVWDRDVAGRILRAIHHRGPDQQGIYEGSEVTLCAVRLKIIDLAGGDQPIVSDDGDGIASRDMPNIFNRFYRGENAGENSVGIGLALAKAILTERLGRAAGARSAILMKAPDLDAALEWGRKATHASRFPVEVRPFMG